MVHLRDGSEVEDVRLGRLYEEDWRSLDYPVGQRLAEEPKPRYRPRSYTWSIHRVYDQGPDGSCVGFAYAHDLVARPGEVVGTSPSFAKEMVYWEAQKIDPWDGGSYPGASPQYEGTSILAGAKVLQRYGFYDSYYWALDIEDLVRGVGYMGPCIFGTNWYRSMYYPDSKGFLVPDGDVVGGHAILIVAVKIKYTKPWKSVMWWTRTWDDVDLDRSYVTIHNSWGPGWGNWRPLWDNEGQAKITLSDLDRLLNENGDACFPERNYDKLSV